MRGGAVRETGGGWLGVGGLVGGVASVGVAFKGRGYWRVWLWWAWL